MVITLGDVMGKGIGAAIVMATVRGAMRAAGRELRPADAVRQAAATLDQDLQETSTIVTLCHLRATLATGDVAYTDAGHGLALLVRADGTPVRSREAACRWASCPTTTGRSTRSGSSR